MYLTDEEHAVALRLAVMIEDAYLKYAYNSCFYGSLDEFQIEEHGESISLRHEVTGTITLPRSIVTSDLGESKQRLFNYLFVEYGAKGWTRHWYESLEWMIPSEEP